VDWQGLIAETRQQASDAQAAQQGVDRGTSAKQRWQPYRVLLDLGISFGMAGEGYARCVMEEARQQLLQEKEQGQQRELDGDEEPPAKIPSPLLDYREFLASQQQLEPLACVQMGLRSAAVERQRLVGNVCGPGSRALSARQDLRLRRQLCGLPARECEFPRSVPIVGEGLRNLAMQMFQRRLLDVKWDPMPGVQRELRYRKPRHYRLDIQIFMGVEKGKATKRDHY